MLSTVSSSTAFSGVIAPPESDQCDDRHDRQSRRRHSTGRDRDKNLRHGPAWRVSPTASTIQHSIGPLTTPVNDSAGCTTGLGALSASTNASP